MDRQPVIQIIIPSFMHLVDKPFRLKAGINVDLFLRQSVLAVIFIDLIHRAAHRLGDLYESVPIHTVVGSDLLTVLRDCPVRAVSEMHCPRLVVYGVNLRIRPGSSQVRHLRPLSTSHIDLHAAFIYRCEGCIVLGLLVPLHACIAQIESLIRRAVRAGSRLVPVILRHNILPGKRRCTAVDISGKRAALHIIDPVGLRGRSVRSALVHLISDLKVPHIVRSFMTVRRAHFSPCRAAVRVGAHLRIQILDQVRRIVCIPARQGVYIYQLRVMLPRELRRLVKPKVRRNAVLTGIIVKAVDLGHTLFLRPDRLLPVKQV